MSAFRQVAKGIQLFLLGCLLLLTSCENSQPIEHFFEGFTPPSHFPKEHYSFDNNPPSQAGFELGRKLFYDPLLSRTGQISCASCHQQQANFADEGKAFSQGVDGQLGTRHSPAMANLAWNPNFMWDGGINHIEVMPVAPITNPLEMDESLSNVVQKLKASKQYTSLFKAAFNQPQITDQQLLFALAQFMGLMISDNSKYDRYVNGKAHYTLEEEVGKKLFDTFCTSCHQGVLQTNFSFKNNGLDTVFSDKGRATITLLAKDEGLFKVPSLRNIAQSAPYMHDGRFSTLLEVVNHYNSGVKKSSTLSNELNLEMNLSESDKEAIVAFLLTLSDYTYLNNSKFSKPD